MNTDRNNVQVTKQDNQRSCIKKNQNNRLYIHIQIWNVIKSDGDDHVDGLRLGLRTAAINGRIVRPPGDI